MKDEPDRNSQQASVLPANRQQKNQPTPWQKELRDSFQYPSQLFEFLGLDKKLLPRESDLTTRFPFKVTRSFANRIEKGNLNDPLLRQILPVTKELLDEPEFADDPVGDLESIAAPGILHKYENRVLLITTGACAIHCRYCFRKNFPYSGNQLGSATYSNALGYIRSHTEIKEVILSGGDPLMLSNANLEQLISAISAIEHVDRLRIHTRIPTVLPSRIEDELVDILNSSRLRSVLVTHINHPREIDDQLPARLIPLISSGIKILNQAVLLKDINDDCNILTELLEKTFDCGIHPYYLHLLDRVKGTGHFEVPESRCRTLEQELRQKLPGYLIPRFVREVAGKDYKVPLQYLT